MSELTAISLFAGVGGFDLALERSGVNVTAAVEIDKAARGVLAERFPNTTLFPDVTEVSADELRATGFVPERGIVAAGWPCQGNSVAGARGGMADPRSGLWRHVVRLLADLRPRWFIGENVPGLLSVTRGEDFGIVLEDLAEIGMGFAYRVMDAQHFGVPQRRRRVFIVGHLGDTRRPVQILLEPEGGDRNPAQGSPTRQGVAGTIADRAQRLGGGGDVAPALTAKYGKGTDSDATDAVIVSTLQGGGNRGYRIDAEAAGGGTSLSCPRRVVAALTANGVGTCGADDNQAQAGHLVAVNENQRGEINLTDRIGALSAGGGKPGQGYPLVSITTTLGERTHALTSEGADASEGGTGRGTPIIAFSHTAGIDQQPSRSVPPTVKAGHDTMPSVLAETTVRRLTPRECERLQGFPDDWTATSDGKPQADSARYRQIGNAVAVPCIEWIVRRLVETDAGEPT